MSLGARGQNLHPDYLACAPGVLIWRWGAGLLQGLLGSRRDVGKLTQASTLPGSDIEHSVSNREPCLPSVVASVSAPGGLSSCCSLGGQGHKVCPSPAPQPLVPHTCPLGPTLKVRVPEPAEGPPQVSPMLPWAPWSPSSRTPAFCSPGPFCPPSTQLWEAPPGPGLQAVWTGLAGCRPQSEHRVRLDREVSGLEGCLQQALWAPPTPGPTAS